MTCHNVSLAPERLVTVVYIFMIVLHVHVHIFGLHLRFVIRLDVA